MAKIGSASFGSQATTRIVSDVTPSSVSPPSSSLTATHSARKKNGMATIPDSVSHVSGNSTSRPPSWAMFQVTTPSGSSPAGAATPLVAPGPPADVSLSASPPRNDTPTRAAITAMTAAIGPALVILDMMMPLTEGWSLFEAVKQDPRLASVPIVLLTCLGDTRETLGAEDVSVYLKKPVRMKKLLSIAAEHCRSSQSNLGGYA